MDDRGSSVITSYSKEGEPPYSGVNLRNQVLGANKRQRLYVLYFICWPSQGSDWHLYKSGG